MPGADEASFEETGTPTRACGCPSPVHGEGAGGSDDLPVMRGTCSCSRVWESIGTLNVVMAAHEQHRSFVSPAYRQDHLLTARPADRPGVLHDPLRVKIHDPRGVLAMRPPISRFTREAVFTHIAIERVAPDRLGNWPDPEVYLLREGGTPAGIDLRNWWIVALPFPVRYADQLPTGQALQRLFRELAQESGMAQKIRDEAVVGSPWSTLVEIHERGAGCSSYARHRHEGGVIHWNAR